MNKQSESQTLGGRLQAERHSRFVGRQIELSLFQSALSPGRPPFSILYTYGPGGVGKTSLLHEFRRLCSKATIPTYFLDGYDVDPSPHAFLRALGQVMDLDRGADPATALHNYERRQVLMIDRYESLLVLDRWFRGDFLPRLPQDMLVVFASRKPPSTAWESDPGWRDLFHRLPLRYLSPRESVAYLTQEDVPLAQHDTILNFTHGHPLALSLVADLFAQGQDLIFQPEKATGVIRKLVERFVENVPDPDHRSALETCAMVRTVTEPLLGDVVPASDTHQLFEWLRGLSFIEERPGGLTPHSLARDALAADLRWRHPERYAELHRRARNYYVSRLQETHGRVQQDVLIDYIFLHRDNSVVRPFFRQLQSQQESAEPILSDRPQEKDWEQLLQMVERHEGPESARLAQLWFERQPQSVILYRDGEGRPVGFLAAISLDQADPQSIASDPAAEASWSYLQAQAPLREGEKATYFRFWMARDTYQAISHTQGLIFVHMVRHYLTTPRLAFSFLPCAEPDFWKAILMYADLEMLPQAQFEVGGREYAVFGHDWRAVPPLAWLDLLAQRETAVDPQSIPRPEIIDPLLVLSQEEFETAVRHALRHLTSPEQLAENPLLHSRLVAGDLAADAGHEQTVQRLQDIIQQTAETLQEDPRALKYYRALHHAYIQPAPTQEKAAEIVNVPYGSFRRHLKRGFEQLTAILWQREIGHA